MYLRQPKDTFTPFSSGVSKVVKVVFRCVHAKMRNELEQAGTIWNKLELPEVRWNRLEHTGATWSRLELPGTTCNEMDSAMNLHKKKQEIHRKTNCASSVIAQWNTTLAIVIVTGRTISDVCRRSHLQSFTKYLRLREKFKFCFSRVSCWC